MHISLHHLFELKGIAIGGVGEDFSGFDAVKGQGSVACPIATDHQRYHRQDCRTQCFSIHRRDPMIAIPSIPRLRNF